jgi:hypothetical protein
MRPKYAKKYETKALLEVYVGLNQIAQEIYYTCEHEQIYYAARELLNSYQDQIEERLKMQKHCAADVTYISETSFKRGAK